MDSLKYSDGKSLVIIDRTGFSHNGRCVRWSEIQECHEVLVPIIDLGTKKYLSIQLLTGSMKVEHWPQDAYMALRIVMKELLPDKVKLEGPRFLKFGPEECEFTLSIARFLQEIGLLAESKFAYNKAIELIEYYHNLKHELLVEPLTALSSMLEVTEPDRAASLLKRAQEIERAPLADQSFFNGLMSARSKKDRIKQALEEFRRQHKREPRRVEKMRIMKELEIE